MIAAGVLMGLLSGVLLLFVVLMFIRRSSLSSFQSSVDFIVVVID